MVYRCPVFFGYIETGQNTKHNFGDLHLLMISNAEYIDGKRKDMPEWKPIDIHLPQDYFLPESLNHTIPRIKREKPGSITIHYY